MEAVTEEVPVLNPPVEGGKSTNIPSEISDTEVCQKSNGVVAEISNTSQSDLDNNIIDVPVPECNQTSAASEIQACASKSVEFSESCSAKQETIQKMSSNNSTMLEQPGDSIEQCDKPDTEVSNNSKSQDLQNTMLLDNINSAKEEIIKEMQNEIISKSENVKFETEILIETNDNDVNELDLNSTNEVSSQESASNILNELGQNIELSEALRSSDNAENGENNNHSVRQEVFNKEELLDILEGNDDDQTPDSVVGYEIEIKLDTADGKSEAQLALEQLSRLKKSRNRKRGSSDIMSRKRNINILKPGSNSNAMVSKKDIVKSKKEDGAAKSKKCESKEKSKKDKNEDSIVNKLVEDWDDDEPVDDETDLKNKCDVILNSTEQLVDGLESIVSQDVTARMSIDSAISDGLTPNKGNEDGQPQRRLGRVIKKKVIYDPDNPDTFTKSKISVKKEPQEEYSPLKKGKVEPIVQRPKSKSPVSKLQWKKPQPKNSKQNRRLTEVDKLLMDEGAVNMIYQLTPEAPKGKKNMRTKAEFIKKIQSSTPETKEMKFRERKVKIEDVEAKKIMSGKQRPSLSSSVKSSSVCGDFETHSADDSIIYRRHSSSSYSSTCMSPRRLSDVEGGGIPSSQIKSVPKETGLENDNLHTDNSGNLSTDVFITPDVENVSTDVINKDDCLSIKEKLNSKLSLALNKRKRESSKIDKPIKQRKLSKVDRKVKPDNDKYTFLSISYDQRVAEIFIRKTGSQCSNVMFKELCQALEEVDTRKDISVTLLMSECGALCSDLDLSSLVNDDIEERTNSAYEYAEDIRLVLFAMIQHSKLLVSGVWGACAGVALALLALSDVALAAERASFALAAGRAVLPGIMLLASPWQSLPQTLVNDLVIFGCTLSAREVHAGGLVSRVLLTAGPASVRLVAHHIAAENPKNILMKKRLLNLKNASNTFLSCLIKERDLIINYWVSDEGQELLRATTTA